jgi:hypothetical protein
VKVEKGKKLHKWTTGWVVIAFTWIVIGNISPAQLKAGTAKGESAAATIETAKSTNPESSSFEKEGEKQEIAKKKKFPWFVVAAGTVLAGAIIYLAFIKQEKHILIVEVGAGASGTPAEGKYRYKKGEKIAYNFTLADGYKNLTVFIDNIVAAPSGTIIMNRAHSVRVETIQLSEYSLVVINDSGIDGTPASGTYLYREGTIVLYDYTVANLVLIVKLDNIVVPVSGSLVMDKDHVLKVSFGTPPDIRGQWHFVIQDAKSTQAKPLMDVSLSGTQTNGVVKVITVYCYQDTFLCCWEDGGKHTYEVNSTSNWVKINIHPNYNTFMWFNGSFKSISTISGTYNFLKSDGPGLQEESGTWTASRIQ